jgi:hypothetical protein
MVSVPLESVGIASATPHCCPAAIDTEGSTPVPRETRGMDERGPLFSGPDTVVGVPDVELAEVPELPVLDPQADSTSRDETTAASRRRVGCRVVTATP